MEPHDWIRAAGSVLGSIVAFCFAWPTGKRDFYTRLVISLIVGISAGYPVREYIGWPETPRYILFVAVVCSSLGWWAIAAGVRILQTMNSLPKKKG